MVLAQLANEGLRKIPGARARVAGVRLQLWRGRLAVSGLEAHLEEPRKPAVHVRVSRVAIGVHWRSLLAGRLIADAVVDAPDITVRLPEAPAPSDEKKDGHPLRRIDDKTWQDKVRELIPFQIKRIVVRNGAFHLQNAPGQDGVDLSIRNWQLLVRNVTNSEALGGTLKATVETEAQVLSKGQFQLHAEVFPLADRPTFNTDVALSGLDLTELSPLAKHFLGEDIRSGQADVYAEMAAAQGFIRGYAKPLIDHLAVEKAQKGFWQSLKTGLVNAVSRIFRSKHEQRIATRVDFSGRLDNPDIAYFEAVTNVLKNAFLRVFSPRLEHSVRFLRDGASSDDIEISIPGERPTKTRNFFRLLKDTASRWSADQVPTLSAALSYYTVFSIAPLLLLTIAIAGLAFGRQAAQGQISTQLSGLLGAQGAQTIQSMMKAAAKPSSGAFATVVSVIVLLAGASGVMTELKDTLNQIWRVQQPSGIGATIRGKILSFTMVLAIGFLLLVSLVISAAMSAAGKFLGGYLPIPEFVMQSLNLLASFAVITALFALIYKLLPDAVIAWRDVWVGSAVTALLFSLGKLVIGLYLGKAGVTSSYGAAGSVLVVLLWVYYSSMILYFGAEFTKLFADRYGSRKSQRPDDPWALKYRSQMGDATAARGAQSAAVSPKAAA